MKGTNAKEKQSEVWHNLNRTSDVIIHYCHCQGSLVLEKSKNMHEGKKSWSLPHTASYFLSKYCHFSPLKWIMLCIGP